MAVLYLARATGPAGFERLFAIKTIHEQLTRDRSFVDMFLDEARLAARIHHPNAVPVYDIGEEDGLYYIAMDYVNGETLAHALTRTWKESPPFPIPLAVHLAESVCEALHAAHELTDASGRSLGVVHRDVSPQNIMIGYDGIARIMDFGVAKAADRIVHTTTGAQKGKVAYMCPEQIRGESVDRRADIFAMGVVLWEVLVGKRLFKASNDFATAERVKECRIVPLRKMRPEVAPELAAIVERCLALNPRDRFPTARDLGQALHEYAVRRSAVLSAADVERFMKTLFADRFAQRQEIARRAVEADGLIDPGSLGQGDSGSFNNLDAAPLPERSGTTPELDVRPFAPDVPATNRAKAAIIAVAAAVTAVTALATLMFLRPPDDDRVVIPAQPAHPAPPEQVRIELDIEPRNATILADGRVVASPLVLPRSSNPVKIEVTAENHAAYTRTVIPDRSLVLAVQLEPLEQEKRAVRRSRAKKKKRLLLQGDDL
jgi:serine/threonine-protein kinase